MHVVLVSRLSGHGGVAVYNRTLARALVELGHSVTIVTARTSPDEPAHEERNGVAIHRLLRRHPYWLRRLPLVGRYTRSFIQLFYSFQVARFLNSLSEVASPDIIEFADVEAEGFMYLRQRDRKPVIVRCHTPTFVLRRYHRPEEMVFSTALTTAMEKSCICHADGLTAPSHDMARNIAEECNVSQTDFRIIPNVLDVSTYIQHVYQEGENNNRVIILHVGRLERVKGVATLVRAIPLIVDQHSQTLFVFIGPDHTDLNGQSYREELEAYCLSHNVSKNVRFLGYVDEPDLISWYNRADIAVVPSLNYESFSYTCAQAMAAGVPVVASGIGGIPETVEDGISGYVVDPGDHKILAQKLLKLVANKTLRHKMGSAGKKRAMTSFNVNTIAEQMIEFYSKVSNSHTSSSE